MDKHPDVCAVVADCFCHRSGGAGHHKLEESQKETLSGLGISGSAVRPNVREKADFQNEFNQMRTPYDLRIDKLKDKMLHLI
ncbi:hypothetical protein ACFLV4_07140 [Chloroflexota bacterium]